MVYTSQYKSLFIFQLFLNKVLDLDIVYDNFTEYLQRNKKSFTSHEKYDNIRAASAGVSATRTAYMWLSACRLSCFYRRNRKAGERFKQSNKIAYTVRTALFGTFYVEHTKSAVQTQGKRHKRAENAVSAYCVRSKNTKDVMGTWARTQYKHAQCTKNQVRT